MTRRGVEDSSARDQLQSGIVARTVDELAGKCGLVVDPDANYGEHQPSAIGEGDEDPIAEPELIKSEEDGRSVVAVNVTEDHS